jgi:hypothetical protein
MMKKLKKDCFEQAVKKCKKTFWLQAASSSSHEPRRHHRNTSTAGKGFGAACASDPLA